MTTALFTVTLLCIGANVFIACAAYLKAGFVLKNFAEVNTPAEALPYLATCKLAGAVGLLIGLVVVPWIGVAAGIGLVLYFVGAIRAHISARVFYNLAFPGTYLLLAVASSAYLIHVARGS